MGLYLTQLCIKLKIKELKYISSFFLLTLQLNNRLINFTDMDHLGHDHWRQSLPVAFLGFELLGQIPTLPFPAKQGIPCTDAFYYQ